MSTIDQRPPEALRDHWTAALKYHATGRTAGSFRAQGADETFTRGMAALSGTTPEQERAWLLAVADAVDALAAEGLTPEKAYRLAGLDRELGPYLSPDAALYLGAAHIAAGHTTATLPASVRPEITGAVAALEDRGVTPAQAARITVTGEIALPDPCEQAAAILMSEGWTPAEVLWYLPGSAREIAAAMLDLAAEGFTPHRLAKLVGLGEVSVPLRCPAPEGVINAGQAATDMINARKGRK